MTSWHEQVVAPTPPPPGRGRLLLRAAIPFGIAGVLAVLGLRRLAVLVAVAGAVLGIVTLIWPSAARHLDRGLAAVGHIVGRVLATVLLGAVELFVFLPLSVVAKLLRRDLLTPGGARGTTGWTDRAPTELDVERRPYGIESGTAERSRPVLRVAYLTVRIVGWVVIALALNYGIGWLWDEYFGSHDAPVASTAPDDVIRTLASSAPMADEAWAPAYWEEFGDLDYEFHPFILSRVAPVDGELIRTSGAERRTYTPRGLADDAPEVWFLGGAATWGQGQRDLHTIPSEVARLAEAAGRPLRAVNLGQPGYTSWQAMLLLEQELAVRPAPDLVVFYDGAADVAVQLEEGSDAPTHYNAGGLYGSLTGRDSAREQVDDWWEEYRETSVVGRLLDGLGGIFGAQPAAADGAGLGDRVADVHARAVDLASFVAEEHEVDALFTWQAADGVPGDGGAYRRVAGDDAAAPGVVDLSEVLDDEDAPVYLDGVLTDEHGAQVVAEHLWPLIDDRF